MKSVISLHREKVCLKKAEDLAALRALVCTLFSPNIERTE